MRWLGPAGLTVTGYQRFLSNIFSWYADKREMQAALHAPQVIDLSDRGSLWFDWLADTGDSFNATYATARLAAGEVAVDTSEGTRRLPRGELLILGGDLAYPAAHPDVYRDRMIGPYRAALPAVAEDEAPPRMLTIAGNHDWYDGLTTFLRLFCQGKPVGAWTTEQTRSYFTVKLPHDWWILGIDLALDLFIDKPQIDYFTHIANDEMKPGDKVIMMMHQPSWLFAGINADADLYSDMALTNLQQFERDVLHPAGLRIPLSIGGHIHHYNRYTREDGSQTRITSGSGAAFVFPTDRLPERILWPESDGLAIYERRSVYPSAKTSKRLRWRILIASLLNPSFILTVGLIYLLFAGALRSAVTGAGGEGFATAMRSIGVDEVRRDMLNEPLTLLLVILLWAGLVGFVDASRLWRRVVIGSIHAYAQLWTLSLVIWAVAQPLAQDQSPLVGLFDSTFDLQISWFLVLYVLGVIVVGGLAGAFVYSLYLFLMQSLWGKHPTDSFSAHRWEHHKEFVRLHLADDGSLTVHTIGLDRVPTRWRHMARQGRRATDPWFEPRNRPITPRLVDGPLRIDPGDPS